MSRIADLNEAIYTGRVCVECLAPEGQLHADNCTRGVDPRLRDHIIYTGSAYDNQRKAAHDAVNSPPHYKQGDIECIDAIEAALTAEEFRGYCKGNALKYVWREKHKGQNESLRKAVWYLNRALGE